MHRNILITGAAKRIGRVIALHLAKAGYNIAIHYNTSQSEADDLKQEINNLGQNAAIISANLEDIDSAIQLVRDASNELGGLYGLVNNASLFEKDDLLNLTPDLWARHFAVNLQSPIMMAAELAKLKNKNEQASIVNILDQRISKLNPEFFSYTLTKTALNDATKTMAQALAPAIRVNAVAPGPTFKNHRQSEIDFMKQAKATILERNSAAEDIAKAVLFCFENTSLTGQTITVDSGQHLVWQTPDIVGIEE